MAREVSSELSDLELALQFKGTGTHYYPDHLIGGALDTLGEILRQYAERIAELPGAFGRLVRAVLDLLGNTKAADSPEIARRVFELVDIIYHEYGAHLDAVPGAFGTILRRIVKILDTIYHTYYPVVPTP